MAQTLLGKFVLAIPSRVAFAISSGSWTDRPANKLRPCLVTAFTKTNKAVISPLCGAVYDRKTESWDIRSRMLEDHWMPVDFKDSGVAIPPLQSSFAPPTLKITANEANLNPKDPKFKPCYLWVADAGEPITIEDLLKLQKHSALEGLSVEQLKVLRELNDRISSSDKRAEPIEEEFEILPL